MQVDFPSSFPPRYLCGRGEPQLSSSLFTCHLSILSQDRGETWSDQTPRIKDAQRGYTVAARMNGIFP